MKAQAIPLSSFNILCYRPSKGFHDNNTDYRDENSDIDDTRDPCCNLSE